MHLTGISQGKVNFFNILNLEAFIVVCFLFFRGVVLCIYLVWLLLLLSGVDYMVMRSNLTGLLMDKKGALVDM